MAASKTITIDFKKMYEDTIKYFKSLTQDLIIAWAVLGVGLVIFIISLFL